MERWKRRKLEKRSDRVTTGSFFPSVFDQATVFCQGCGNWCQLATCRVLSKKANTWRCKICSSKVSALGRVMGGWPPAGFKHIPTQEIQQFFRSSALDGLSAERMKKALGFIKNPFQSARELLGAKPLEAQEMTDSTAKQIAAYNQAENTLLKEEVSMTDSQGNSLGSTTDEILGNIEKSSNINYNESTKLFEPYQVRKADGTLEPFWTIGVGQRLTQSLPVDANGVITSAPPAGQTKEQVI